MYKRRISMIRERARAIVSEAYPSLAVQNIPVNSSCSFRRSKDSTHAIADEALACMSVVCTLKWSQHLENIMRK